jgi:hypothetical protein
MSRRKVKRTKARAGRNPTIEDFQPKAKKPWIGKRAVKRLLRKARNFGEDFRSGKEIAAQSTEAAGLIKDRMDKAELLDAAKVLRVQAKAIEAIANTM